MGELRRIPLTHDRFLSKLPANPLSLGRQNNASNLGQHPSGMDSGLVSRMLHMRRKTLAVERFSDLLTASSSISAFAGALGVGSGGKSSTKASPEKEDSSLNATESLPVHLQPVLQSKLARQRQAQGQAASPAMLATVSVAGGSPQESSARAAQTPKMISFAHKLKGGGGAAEEKPQRPHASTASSGSASSKVLKIVRPDLPLHMASPAASSCGRQGSAKRHILGVRSGPASKSVQFSPPPEAIGRYRNHACTHPQAHSVSFSLGAGLDDGSNSSPSASASEPASGEEEAGAVFEPIDLHSPGADGGPCETEPVARLREDNDREQVVDVHVPPSRAFREPSPEAAIMASSIIPPPPPVVLSPTCATSPLAIRVQVSFSGIEFDECSPTHEPPSAESTIASPVETRTANLIPSGQSAFVPCPVAIVAQPTVHTASSVPSSWSEVRSQVMASTGSSTSATVSPPLSIGTRIQIGRLDSAFKGQQQRRPPMVRAPEIVVDPPSDPDFNPEDV